MRRKIIPGECFPLHEMVHFHIAAREEADSRFELVGLAWILGKYNDGIVLRSSQLRDCQCGARANELAPAERLPGPRQLLRRADEEGLLSHFLRLRTERAAIITHSPAQSPAGAGHNEKTPGQFPARAFPEKL